eukprot:jgi/Galph1/3751/GphlegSOOS_G2404.1
MNRGRGRRSFRRTASPIRRTVQELDQQKFKNLQQQTQSSSLIFPTLHPEKLPKAVLPKGSNNRDWRQLCKRIYTYSDYVLLMEERNKKPLFEDPLWLRPNLLPGFLNAHKPDVSVSRITTKKSRIETLTDMIEQLPQDSIIKLSNNQRNGQVVDEDFFVDQEGSDQEVDDDDDYAQGEVFDDDEEYETTEVSDSEPIL